VKSSFITFIVSSAVCIGVASAEDLLSGADFGYGEYLSGECVTCHSQTGLDRGIPAINGLDPESSSVPIRVTRSNPSFD